MLAKTFAAAVHGVDARIIEVEVNACSRFSLHFFKTYLTFLNKKDLLILHSRMSQFATTFKNPGYEK